MVKIYVDEPWNMFYFWYIFWTVCLVFRMVNLANLVPGVVDLKFEEKICIFVWMLC